jgi:hypothetical protein
MSIRFTVGVLFVALVALVAGCRGEEAGRDQSLQQEASSAAPPAQEQAPQPGVRGFEEAGKDVAKGAETAAKDAEEAAKDAAGVAKEIPGNVEESAHVYDKTYKAERKKGDNPLEAGGDAYDSVLEIPDEQKTEEQKKPAETP